MGRRLPDTGRGSPRSSWPILRAVAEKTTGAGRHYPLWMPVRITNDEMFGEKEAQAVRSDGMGGRCLQNDTGVPDWSRAGTDFFLIGRGGDFFGGFFFPKKLGRQTGTCIQGPRMLAQIAERH